SAGGAAKDTTTVALDKAGNVITDSSGNPVKVTNGQEIAFDKNGQVIRDKKGDPVFNTVAKQTLPLTALGALTPLQALAVKALFAAEPDTVYNRVAPGISLGVRPTVLRDGGSARLQINLVTNADVDPTTDPRKTGAPVDRIRGHSLETDV